MRLPPATKPSPKSVTGEKSDSWRWVPAIGRDTTSLLFEERGKILVITVKRDGKGELLEH
jgi:hypothetical protein